MARSHQKTNLNFNSSFRCRTVGEFILRLVVYLLIKNGKNKNVKAVYIITGSKQEIFNQQVLKVNAKSSAEIFIFNINWVWNLAVRDKYGLYLLNFTLLSVADYLYLLTYGSNVLSQIKSSSKQKLNFLKVFQVHNISETSNLNITLLNIDFIRFLFWLISDKYRILFELSYDQLKHRINETSLYNILNRSVLDTDPNGTNSAKFATVNIAAATNPSFRIDKISNLKIGFADKKLSGKAKNLGSMFEIAPTILLDKIDIPVREIPSKIIDLFVSNLNNSLINHCEHYIQDNSIPDFSIKSFYSIIWACAGQIAKRYIKKETKGCNELADCLDRIKRFFMKVPFHGADVDRNFSKIEKNGLSIFFDFVESYTFVTHSKIEESDDEHTSTPRPSWRRPINNSQIKKEVEEIRIPSIDNSQLSHSDFSARSKSDKNIDEEIITDINEKNNVNCCGKYEKPTVDDRLDCNNAKKISKTSSNLSNLENQNNGNKEIRKQKIELFPKDPSKKESLFDKKETRERANMGLSSSQLRFSILQESKYGITNSQMINADKYVPKIPVSKKNQEGLISTDTITEIISKNEKRKYTSEHSDQNPKKSKYTLDHPLSTQKNLAEKSKSDDSRKYDFYKDTVNLIKSSLPEDHFEGHTSENIQKVLIQNNSRQKGCSDFGFALDEILENLNLLCKNFKSQFAEISNYGMISREAQITNFIKKRSIDLLKKHNTSTETVNLPFSENNTNYYNYISILESVSKKVQANMEEILPMLLEGRVEIDQVCKDYEKKLADLKQKHEYYCNQIESLSQ